MRYSEQSQCETYRVNSKLCYINNLFNATSMSLIEEDERDQRDEPYKDRQDITGVYKSREIQMR